MLEDTYKHFGLLTERVKEALSYRIEVEGRAARELFKLPKKP